MWNKVCEVFVSEIFPEIYATLYMLFFSSVLSLLIGTLIAVIITITQKDHFMPNAIVNKVLSTIVSVLMAFPFIVLAVACIPVTKFFVGTTIGPSAAIIPLSVAETPFVAKLFCDSLLEVDKWVLEAAKAFGATKIQLIRILIHEALPNMVRDFTASVINILNDTSLMGAIGAGGLGAAALISGYRRGNVLVIWEAVFVLVIMVFAIQTIGGWIGNKLE